MCLKLPNNFEKSYKEKFQLDAMNQTCLWLTLYLKLGHVSSSKIVNESVEYVHS